MSSAISAVSHDAGPGAEAEKSSACPHGRPTTVKLTLRELEKQFKRV